MCISSQIYLVTIGNVSGAHQIGLLPDPDWKAEDQQGAPASISRGNNNHDDAQGGDMPSWMYKEESNRRETKKIALKKGDLKKKSVQCSPKRMITMLDWMSNIGGCR